MEKSLDRIASYHQNDPSPEDGFCPSGEHPGSPAAVLTKLEELFSRTNHHRVFLGSQLRRIHRITGHSGCGDCMRT